MPPQDSCAPSTINLHCPTNYVVVVRSASYGVAQVLGSCTYTKGDCTVDAMNIMICDKDSVDCNIYVTKRQLSQCNNHFASYIHVEFDCVPILMEDSSKEYNICQDGSEITSDHGIIKSPGYPSQFQTTTIECFRAIHVPINKTIRLWLSDLYIGSSSTNCAEDHLIVVDSIQTYRYCGFKRYAYPYLCSSTIIIQYLVTNGFASYRGTRMYFEIIDRPPNDICPNPGGTVTPVPATTPPITSIDPYITTPTPIYVTLGIASPVRSLQLCRGDSYQFICPNNYILIIITNIFGITGSDHCESYDASKHCAITTNPTFMCLQSCYYIYTGHQIIESCGNKTADYQYIEYQCIPTNTELISNTPCPTDGTKISIHIDQRGRFQSYNYPKFETMNCIYHLTTKPGHIMHFYSIDISMNDDPQNCQPNKLTLIEADESQGVEFCAQQTHSLIHSSCSNEIDLLYIVTNNAQWTSKGAELYIETQEYPSGWCDRTTSTPINPPITSTTPFTTPTATPLRNESLMFARDEIDYDICLGNESNNVCPMGYTFMILGAFYGVKNQASNKCGFVQGDCVQEALSTITHCRNDVPNCYITYPTKLRLSLCSDNYADYLHITSQCVPSISVGPQQYVQTYDICGSTDDIKDLHGVMISPNFPTFKQTHNECKRTIVSAHDRILKIWINEIAVSSGGQRRLNDDSDSNEPDLVIYKNHNTDNLNDIEQMFPSIRDTCINDYLMINAPHVAYVYCGTRKLVIAPICAQNVVIHYKSTSPPSSFYKGFKFYFEWIEKPMEISCGGTPSSGNTTTPPEEPIPDWAQNLQLSPRLSAHICLGTSTTLRCPRGSDYVLSIIESHYAVTGSGFCEIPTASHCYKEVSLGLTCTHSCFIEYIIPELVSQCGSQNADYLTVDYECIPTRLPNNENPIDICSSPMTDTITLDSVLMISPQYPTLGGANICSKKIQTVNYKLWMVFIVDLFIEGENDAGNCDTSSLTIHDGIDSIILCGLQQPKQVLISCSDIIEFKFISTHYALGYRGFKVYFQTIDVPAGWACKPTGFTTMTTTAEPPTTTTVSPPTVQIAAYGGTTNGTRQYCKLPFIYQGKSEANCLRLDPPSSTSGQDFKGPWCSLTSNFDNDHQWGFCELGVTDPIMHDICVSQSQLLMCPPGYVIDILTANYGAKPDGNNDTNVCIYDQNDCFQSDASAIQRQCAGLALCPIYHFTRPLISCQHQPSAYFHIDYTCIPKDIPEISKYDMCSSSVIQNDTHRGFIMSPDYPSAHINIDCTFHLQILKSHQDIYLYIVEMDLNGPHITGENCVKDRLIVTADNTINEICGKSYTNLLVYTCHESITLQLIRTSGAIGLGVKFYFEFRDKPTYQLCPSLPTTTTLSTLSPPLITTTTPGPLPDYFPNPSPRMLKSLCYPDYSGFLDIKNFECPSGYVLVILRSFYGHGTSRCDYTSGDCILEADDIRRQCAGKQSCSVSFVNIILIRECGDLQATYLFVEYQCLPTTIIVSNSTDLCTGKIDPAGVSGIFKSSSYPTYTPTQCINTMLSVSASSNLVIYMYLLDLNIGSPNQTTGECSNDYLLLSYQCNNQIYDKRLCGAQSTELLFSTCQSTDQIFVSYSLLGQDSQTAGGFTLLYHLLPKTITPSGPGPLSTNIQSIITCVPHPAIIKCDISEYALVLHKVLLGVSATNSCTYSPNDCFEDHTNWYNYCGGQTFCDIFPRPILINQCNNSQANYLYVEYQCIPRRPKINIDACSFNKSYERIDGGAVISSLNYISASKSCTVLLRSDKLLGSNVHKAFKIYILTLNLPTQPVLREQGAQCSENDPYIDIDDHELSVTRLCGNSHTRYLLETCSTMVELRYNNRDISTGAVQYKGFEIYFESIQNDECLATVPPVIPTPPFVIKNEVVCALADGHERVDFSCTPNHGLVFLQSYHFVTTQPEQCNVTQHTCFYQSEQPQEQCSGQQACSYTHIIPSEPAVHHCPNEQADSVEFYYQCLPMRPSIEYPTYTFCSDQHISSEWGFIETAHYPNSYQYSQTNCSLSIQLSNDAANKNDFIFLYTIELSILDSSVINSSSITQCLDSINYIDGDSTRSLCGKIDQPLLQYHTNKKELSLTLSISHVSSSIDLNTWKGARLFFFIGNQSLPSPPTTTTTAKPSSPTTVTTKPSPPTTVTAEPLSTMTVTTIPSIKTTSEVDATSQKTTPGSNNDGLIIALVIIGILAVLVSVLGFIYYRRRSRSRGNHLPVVKYDVDMGIIDGTTSTEDIDRRSSIPTDSLKGPASSTFVSPFYRKSETNGFHYLEDATDV